MRVNLSLFMFLALIQLICAFPHLKFFSGLATIAFIFMTCDQLLESSKAGRLDDMRELLNEGADIDFKGEVRPL